MKPRKHELHVHWGPEMILDNRTWKNILLVLW